MDLTEKCKGEAPEMVEKTNLNMSAAGRVAVAGLGEMGGKVVDAVRKTMLGSEDILFRTFDSNGVLKEASVSLFSDQQRSEIVSLLGEKTEALLLVSALSDSTEWQMAKEIGGMAAEARKHRGDDGNDLLVVGVWALALDGKDDESLELLGEMFDVTMIVGAHDGDAKDDGVVGGAGEMVECLVGMFDSRQMMTLSTQELREFADGKVLELYVGEAQGEERGQKAMDSALKRMADGRATTRVLAQFCCSTTHEMTMDELWSATGSLLKKKGLVENEALWLTTMVETMGEELRVRLLVPRND